MPVQTLRLAAALTLAAAPALAGPVTPEGTARLTGVLQTYLGRTPGVVSVQPGDGVYEVRLDASPLAALIPAEGGRLVVEPWTFTLEDNGDGTWDYAQDQRDWGLAFTVPGQIDLALRYGTLSGRGVFDERLMAFTTYSGSSSDMVMNQVITPPGEPAQRTTYAAASGTYDSTAAASAAKGVDGTVAYTLSGVTQTMQVPGIVDPAATTEVTVTMDRSVTSGTTTGVDMPALYGLVAWLVARPSAEAIRRDQAELKTRLAAGLPFFERIEATSTVEGIRVATPAGAFGAAAAAVDVALGGLVRDGLFREGISVTGLTMPPGLLPDWAAGLVPEDASIGFEVTGFDLATPAATLLPALDLTSPDLIDPAVLDSVLPQLLPTGAVTISVLPGGTKAPLYTLTYEGTMQAGPGTMPTGRAMVTMTGMDAVIESLNAGGLTAQDGIGPALAMARGMARPGADGALVWEIDATVPGTLLINGTDYAPMLGGAQ